MKNSLKKLRPTVSIIHIRTHNHNHNHQLPPPPPPSKQICSCCHLFGTLLLPPRRNSILTPPYPITAHYCVAAPITPTTQGFQSRLLTLHGRSSEPSSCLRSRKLLPHHPAKFAITMPPCRKANYLTPNPALQRCRSSL
ncbi:hypothetical protein TIFTF001_015227 [Ficus carica]|uniref:Uncharacterized protein n=1 Tax=Ficus carica TaxID=3494 RepID=A0AA88AHD9_FICCA|nr:hypothetical protein TIFTF001_015227 [Ficus carica]